MLTVRPSSSDSPKRTRKAISERHRQILRQWYFSQNPRPTQRRLGEWFAEQYDHKLSQATISESLGDSWKFLDTQQTLSETTLRHRVGQWDLLEKKLVEWRRQYEAEGGVVKGQMLLDRARELWPTIPEYAGESCPEFSMGWLTRFKERHGMTKRTRRNKARTAAKTPDTSMVDQDMEQELWPSMDMADSTVVSEPDVDSDEAMNAVVRACNTYAHENIYHIEVTGLFWRQAPGHGARTPSSKRDKARLAVVCCTNASGTDKLPLWLIGHARQPPSLAGVNLAAMRAYWRSNKKAWIDGIIMKEWLVSFYQHIAGRSVVLLLSQSNAHKLGIDVAPAPSNVRVEWLPKQAEKFHPLSQGAVQTFKNHYRKQWLEFVTNELDSNRDPTITVDLRYMLRWVSRAWNHDIQSATIVSSFQASGVILCLDTASWTVSDIQEIGVLFNDIRERLTDQQSQKQLTLKQFLNPQHETPTESEQDIIHRHGATIADDEAEQAEMDTGLALPIYPKDALRAVRVLQQYRELDSDTAAQDIGFLQLLERQIEMKITR